MYVLAFPAIDPVALEIGPLAIRWYALAYVVSLLAGWRLVRWLAAQPPQVMRKIDVDDLLVWMTFGIILGGRIGYVLFYQREYYLRNPGEALMIWHGGMSFHGGMIGVISAILMFGHLRKLDPFRIGDCIAVAGPIGPFIGRLANFVNGELYGRPSDVPWAMVFPRGGPEPRHPSQIYQSLMEGLLLFLVMIVLARRESIRERPGLLAGVFLVGYGIARSIGELFRQPDAQIGYLAYGITMGQLLSVPVVLFGVILIVRARMRPPAEPYSEPE